jgi:polyhydroxybutyrate depolymerase
MTLRGAIRYDAGVSHSYRTCSVLLLSLAAHWGCTDSDTSPDGTSGGTGPDSVANAGAPNGGGSSVVALSGPSAGCGLDQGIPANPAVPDTILTFPPTYDGNTPVPLVFGFHGANRTNENQRLVDSRTIGSDLEANYVVAYLKSSGNAWNLAVDYPRLEAVLQQILAEHCIDTGSLFAFGHSSGAQFISQMLGDSSVRETRFAGVVPVSSSKTMNPAWSPVPTLVIHGLNDNQRSGDTSGAIDVTQYTESNQCNGETQPLDVPSCSSFSGNVAVNPGCVEYLGCAAKTLFCNHDDPNYIDAGVATNHGWPCFANSQIFQFFESLR